MTPNQERIYAGAIAASKAYHDVLAACTHDDRAWNISFRWPCVRVQACDECVRATRPLATVCDATFKQARKAELAEQPRCEAAGCNKRGTWKFPYEVLVCGRHRTAILKAHARVTARMGGLALCVATYTGREDLLRWASEG